MRKQPVVADVRFERKPFPPSPRSSCTEMILRSLLDREIQGALLCRAALCAKEGAAPR